MRSSARCWCLRDPPDLERAGARPPLRAHAGPDPPAGRRAGLQHPQARRRSPAALSLPGPSGTNVRSCPPPSGAKTGRPLYQHALLARRQLVRGHDDPVHLLSPQRAGSCCPRRSWSASRASTTASHYPSDVLAGAILGAGYAAAAVWSLNALWHWAGRKWFPLWWEKFPSLLEPVPARPNRSEDDEPRPQSPPRPRPSPFRHRHRGPALAAAGLHLDCSAAAGPARLTSPAGPFN